RRLQPRVLPPALPRRDRDAAPHLYISGRRGLDRRQLRLHRRRVRHRRERAALHRQRLAKPSSRGAGTGGSVGWTHTRVAAVGALTHVSMVVIGALCTIWCIFRLALEHHRTHAHADQTGVLGLDHRKMAMWVFLGSECFFFGTLVATYLAYKGRSVVGPAPHEIFNIPVTSLSTFDLLMSSLLMVLALAAVQRGDRRQALLWLFGTAVFG